MFYLIVELSIANDSSKDITISNIYINDMSFQKNCFMRDNKSEQLKVSFIPFASDYCTTLKKMEEEAIKYGCSHIYVSEFNGDEVNIDDFDLIYPGKRIAARGVEEGLLVLQFGYKTYSKLVKQPITLTIIASTKKYKIPLEIEITDLPADTEN
ncbi:MAG: hypothetical protein FWD05_07370 [Oscillospiraceae bacterium]|nr:hypothetical protein [Oscillospiraceae bacterium]